MEPIVPAPDVLPLPAPLWLCESLLVLTFVLHLVPMNFLLGGGILAALSHMRAGRDGRHGRLARRLSELMPGVVAFTVTLGVAPLLFVQLLYGQFLYSSSILMARAWFAVIPLVIVGYYLVYLLRFKWDALGGFRSGLAWLVAGLFAVVGFIYSNNFTLMLRPDTWAAHYFAHAATGRLNWSDPALYPRYLHMLVGAVAVAGIWILLLGLRRRSGDPAWSDWALTYGARIFLHATLLNVLIGFWFLLALPKRVMMIFMGGNLAATIMLFAAIFCTAAAWLLISRAARAPARAGSALAGSGFLLAVMLLMAVMRQKLRAAYREPYFRLDELATESQWGPLAMFAVTLVVGLAVLAWLIRTVLSARPAEAPADR